MPKNQIAIIIIKDKNSARPATIFVRSFNFTPYDALQWGTGVVPITAKNIRDGLRILSNHPQSIIFFDSGITNTQDLMLNYSRYKIPKSRMIVASKGVSLKDFADGYRVKNPIKK